MTQSVLNLHSGGHEVSRSDLALIEAPPPTDTWFPNKHSDVLDAAWTTLEAAGFGVTNHRLSVSHEGKRFFATLDLTASIVDGIGLAVGIRNSTDKTFPIGWCAGQRVFVCSNLAFTSEIVVSKKHTRYGEQRYREGIAAAVQSLSQYQEVAAQWINRLRDWRPSREKTDSIILQAYEEGLIGARTLPLVIDEWRKPSHEAFRDGSAWSLWNCFTTCLGKQDNPAKAALTTIKLQSLFQPEVIDGTATLAT